MSPAVSRRSFSIHALMSYGLRSAQARPPVRLSLHSVLLSFVRLALQLERSGHGQRARPRWRRSGRREDHRAGLPHHPIPSALRLGVAHQLTGLITSPDRPASWPRPRAPPRYAPHPFIRSPTFAHRSQPIGGIQWLPFLSYQTKAHFLLHLLF
jgi:hypothetical protein